MLNFHKNKNKVFYKSKEKKRNIKLYSDCNLLVYLFISSLTFWKISLKEKHYRKRHYISPYQNQTLGFENQNTRLIALAEQEKQILIIIVVYPSHDNSLRDFLADLPVHNNSYLASYVCEPSQK